MSNNPIKIRYLLKFGTKVNIEKLYQSGEIYMNTINFFQNFEKLGVGDKLEGTKVIINGNEGTFILEMNESSINLNLNNFQIRNKMSGNIGNIYSTYALHNQLLNRKSIHRLDKRMSEFGEYCVIIKDVNKFINLIISKLNELNYSTTYGVVTYHDYAKNKKELNLFDKSNKFNYQKEFRIIADSDINEPIKFRIGSIKNFAELYSTVDLIENAIFR